MARERPSLQHSIRILISYGGSFKDPRSPATTEPGRGKVRYAGGETRVISVDRRGINLRKLLARISRLIPGALLSLPADPPGHWLSHHLIWAADIGEDGCRGQILVPILGDRDVLLMVAEHDRLVALGKPARLRVFLCDSEPSSTWQFGQEAASTAGSGDPHSGIASSSSRTTFLERGTEYFPPSESPAGGALTGVGCFSGARHFGIYADPNVLQTITSGIPDLGNLQKKTRDPSDAAVGGSHLRRRSENQEPPIRSRTESLEMALLGDTGRRAPGPPPLPQTIKPLQGRRIATNVPPSNPPSWIRSGDIKEAAAGCVPGVPSDTCYGLGIKKSEAPSPTEARKIAFLPTEQLLEGRSGNEAQWPMLLRRLEKEDAVGGSPPPPGGHILDSSAPSPCTMGAIDQVLGRLESLPNTRTQEETARVSSLPRQAAGTPRSPRIPELPFPETAAFSQPGDPGNRKQPLSPASEAAALKADAKVQAGTFDGEAEDAEIRGKLPSAYSQLSTGHLQTIKSADLEEIRELGSGSYGTVFHGKWKGSDVAIKRLKASCFSGGDAVGDRLIAEFWKEAHLLAQLHHPNLVALYGVVTDAPGTSLATVTEFMVNGSLKQVLRRKDRIIDRRKRLIIAMDAAFGMEYLHEKGVVHFDLKSHNFLVNMKDPHRPICKIGDLGLSKVKRRTLVSGGVRGTIPWMAPELLNCHSNLVTDKVDVYSFGIVMWELLTGEEPYRDMPSEEVIVGIIKGDLRPEIPTWCEPTWRSLMERCWAADPAARPPFSEISKELRAMAAAMNIV